MYILIERTIFVNQMIILTAVRITTVRIEIIILLDMEPIFNKIQKQKADFIRKNKYAKFSNLRSSQIQDLAIVWCYYSGKIEGNTYTYVETEALLKDGITSPKRYSDAKMLKNLYNTFISCAEQINKDGQININSFTVNSIHSMLTDELVPTHNRGLLRTEPVAITGTSYIPPKDPDSIKDAFDNILANQEVISNPLERAVYLHCNLARLQPFIDGNKRTSRVLESIVLMNADIIPVYSSKDEDLINYRTGLIHFYETQDYTQYADYFLNRQITRINDMSPSKATTFDLVNNRVIEPDCGMEL